jgi:hypothetical protein
MKKCVNTLNLSHFIDETHKQIIAKIRTDIIHGLDIRVFSNSTTKAKLQMVATIPHNKRRFCLYIQIASKFIDRK